MTVQQITDQASIIRGIPLNTSYTMRLINIALVELATMFYTATRTEVMEIGVEENESFVLPEDTLSVIKVSRVDNGKEIKYRRYEYTNFNISFNNKGVYRVTLRLLPDEVETPNDEPDIHMAYHPVLVKYIAFLSEMYEDKESVSSSFLHESAVNSAETVHNNLKKGELRNKRMPARMWR